jgi:hypothetical protein
MGTGATPAPEARRLSVGESVMEVFRVADDYILARRGQGAIEAVVWLFVSIYI